MTSKAPRPSSPAPSYLTSVAVAGRPLQNLPHALEAIHGFLNPLPLWTIESAASKSHIALLNRLLKCERPDVGEFFRWGRFRHGVEKAAVSGDLELIDWWTAVYLPDHEETLYGSWSGIAADAGKNGHLHVLQWMQAKGVFPTSSYESMNCTHANVLHWLHEQKISISVTVELHEVADLELLKWVQEHRDLCKHLSPYKNPLEGATRRGDLAMIQHLIQTQPEVQDRLEMSFRSHYQDAQSREWSRLYRNYHSTYFKFPGPDHHVHDGVLSVVRWLATEYQWKDPLEREAWTSQAINHAASAGHVEMMEIVTKGRDFSDNRCNVFKWPLWMAALHGHVDMIKWLLANGPNELHREHCSCLGGIVTGAAAGGHLFIVQWMLGIYPDQLWSSDAMGLAAWSGNLSLLQWMYKRPESFRCSRKAMDLGAEQGHLEIIQWLHEHCTEGCTTNAVDDAARNGHLDVVQWLVDNRSEGFSASAISDAATNGHIDIARLLYSRLGHPLPLSKAMRYAASDGHLEVVRWLHQSLGIRPGRDALSLAAENGHLATVAYLFENFKLRCSYCSLEAACANGHNATIEWLFANGCINAKQVKRVMASCHHL